MIDSNEATKFDLKNNSTITGFHTQTKGQVIFSVEAGVEKVEKMWNLDFVRKLKEYSLVFFDSSYFFNQRNGCIYFIYFLRVYTPFCRKFENKG